MLRRERNGRCSKRTGCCLVNVMEGVVNALDVAASTLESVVKALIMYTLDGVCGCFMVNISLI